VGRCSSQVAALELVLGKRCADLVSTCDDGRGHGPGERCHRRRLTRDRPDLVAVVTDGYENSYEGDLGAGRRRRFRGSAIETSGRSVHGATFGHSDDLSLRQPRPAVPQRTFWHEAISALVLWMLFNSGTVAATWQRAALTERLVHCGRRP
jgi:hypothetical protein